MTDTAVERYQHPTGLTMPDDRQFNALWRMSERYAKSGLLPDQFKDKPEAVMAAALTCFSSSMPVNLQTISQFYWVKGKIQPSTQFCIALAAQHGIELWFDEASDGDRAVAYAQRGPNGRVHRYEFTMAMADRAGLAKQDTYKQYGPLMLRYRAASHLLRTAYPDALLGVPPRILDEGLEPIDRATLQATAVDVTDQPDDTDIVDAEIVDHHDEPNVVDGDWVARLEAGCAIKLWPGDTDDVRHAKLAALIAFATEGRTSNAAQVLGGDEEQAVAQTFRGLQTGELVVTTVDDDWVVSKMGQEPY